MGVGDEVDLTGHLMTVVGIAGDADMVLASFVFMTPRRRRDGAGLARHHQLRARRRRRPGPPWRRRWTPRARTSWPAATILEPTTWP
ncbi:MAG: hypothetical protein R2690_11545 [Acidimicrobiales bacterium]